MFGACLPPIESATPSFRPNPEIIPLDTSLLLAESDHRIANHLSLLMGYVRLKTADMDRQREAPSRQAMRELLDGIGAQIAVIAKLHRALVSDGSQGSADLGEHLREICQPLACGLSGTVWIVEDFAPGCVVGPEQVIPLSQIAAEVITNALKHASEGAGPSAVLVRCRKEPGGDVRLEVIDNGGGFPAGFNPETGGGLGFGLVRGLSRSLGAHISFESAAGGVRFRLTLPAPTSERSAAQRQKT